MAFQTSWRPHFKPAGPEGFIIGCLSVCCNAREDGQIWEIKFTQKGTGKSTHCQVSIFWLRFVWIEGRFSIFTSMSDAFWSSHFSEPLLAFLAQYPQSTLIRQEKRWGEGGQLAFMLCISETWQFQGHYEKEKTLKLTRDPFWDLWSARCMFTL